MRLLPVLIIALQLLDKVYTWCKTMDPGLHHGIVTVKEEMVLAEASLVSEDLTGEEGRMSSLEDIVVGI